MSLLKKELPTKEHTVYNGDTMIFCHWLIFFEALGENKRNDPSDRLYYLSLYTKGEPRDVIEGYLALNTEEAYKDTKELQIERFGKSCRTVIAVIGFLSLDSIDENKILLDKLPHDIINQCNRI